METSKRNTYVEVKSYVFYLLAKAKNKSVSMREGGNPYNSEDRHSFVKYKKNIFEYKKDCFTDGSSNILRGANGTVITSPEELVKELGLTTWNDEPNENYRRRRFIPERLLRNMMRIIEAEAIKL